MRRKTVRGKNTVLAVLATGLLLTAGCANSEQASDGTPTAAGATASGGTTTSGAVRQHNQADIAFAQQMIPHHAQAVEMAKLVAGRDAGQKVVDLARRVEQAQQPEIDQMTAWLREWGAAPTTTADGHAGHSGHGGAGMMSEQQMTALRAARGAEFDRQWVRMMIEHHRGAVEMARTEQAQGASLEARALAGRIIDAQQAEIAEMTALLDQGQGQSQG
ncbi:DUF305 domain-containing protein [Streptoalloteichus hindustanus]|uniref:Uncharacterized conserved protein, DUF305 family n=1 Tax=Streptoalloteichus hindustanus TaxID=2017 RepID=A0A1M5JG21_STRHI|nr:DUF305 domain-containing protein [Streptoalloteichus hindustanus]SHG39497.1 Uncharacterized conserved protein, DUF305 family [Streptoalloteichus hindustanus]